MTTFIIANPDAKSECFRHLREMRERRERLDILFQSEEMEVVGAHLNILTAYYPVFREHLRGSSVIHVRMPKFPLEVINAAIEFAYGGVERLSPGNAIKLYHLAHIFENGNLIRGCINFIRERMAEINVLEVWCTANASKNEDLISVCAPHVVMNWETLRASGQLNVNTGVVGMQCLLGCTQMADVPSTSKVEALFMWMNSSVNEEECSARLNAFRDLLPLLEIQNVEELLADLNAREVDILKERGDERLAYISKDGSDTVVRIFRADCSAVETEHKLTDRRCLTVVSFQNKLVFIGGEDDANSPWSSRVDSLDPTTGEVTTLLNMITARWKPACVATENSIFVFGDWWYGCAGAFSSEVYDGAVGRWSPLPAMIEERKSCAAVNIPDIGVLVIGGNGKKGGLLRSTELLTRLSVGAAEGGDERWQWQRHFPPMNGTHKDVPLAVYFQRRVYVVGYAENIDEMEVLDVEGGGQWTSLASFGASPSESPSVVCSMARVGDQLFVEDGYSLSVYSIELKVDPKRQHEKLGQRKEIPNVEISGCLTMLRFKGQIH